MGTGQWWWMYCVIGVTTAVRQEPTIGRTLESLSDSGCDLLHCFSDYGSTLPPKFEFIKNTQRDKLLGAWGNWFYSLKFLTENYPAELYGMVQDDVIVCPNVIPYIREHIPQDADCVSIFTPSCYKDISRWKRHEWRGSKLWMAQALFFTRDAALSLLNSEEVWRIEGTKNIDNRVGLWAKYNGRRLYYHTPSLAQHIGETSTLWGDLSNQGYRSADDYHPDNILYLQDQV
jgi:hypothetical protein